RSSISITCSTRTTSSARSFDADRRTGTRTRSWDRGCSNWARSSISEMTVMRIHTGIARRNRRLMVWVVPMLSLGVVGPGATAEQGNASYQERHAKGQNIAPAYEGWEANPDGTFNLVFGYMNRNWEEQPD